MAKLVRRKGKLLRIAGKLVRSLIDLNPDSPCECCSTPPPPPPPPDPGTWFCNARTGVCEYKLQAGGYATQALCQANCQAATQTWNCDTSTGICVAVFNNQGTYLTFAECSAACQGNDFL